ncbi:LacI family transcriptional regulator [Mesobacillus campisalis]|uniref:LacI family transcriptional regulator n=1 Tax=Mesobacillus campisalis TaxID=1408103 RepID=A0A0M2T242_9BACI|nr:substrate-binding domain-containing protein [Mesobacillus campisalis]KKK40046.1 LacI family transcriptional regulator [Mesobacillus campisalis]
MKKLLTAVFTIFIVLSLVACGSQSEAVSKKDTKSDSGTESIKIGYSINTLNNPFFVEVKKAAEAAAKEAGMSISVVNANNDLATQMNGIEDLIQQKVDVIIIDAVDSKGTVPAVISANEAGIPVITTGRKVEGGEIQTHLGYDEVNNGVTAGEYLAKQIKEKGKVIELQGTTGTDVARDRSKGFQEAMGKFSDIEIVASQSADFDRAKALAVMENILQANPDVVGLYAANDEMALGALQAIKAANKDIVIVSNDGTEDALQAVQSKEIAGTMAISPSDYGKKAIEIASSVAKEESQPEFIELPANFVSSENVSEALKK